MAIVKYSLPLTVVLLGGMLSGPANADQAYALDSVSGLQAFDVALEAVNYKGRKAVRVTPKVAADAERAALKNDEGGGIAVVTGSSFHNGTIELLVAGRPRAGAVPDARGFVGVAFRVASDPTKYECFYIRPTNARAEEQVRRNHSAQYISMPTYQWSRLRKESPERYESYVDLIPGEWTALKVVVAGSKARLFVNGSTQPTLIVNDLKLGDTKGAIALWIGLGTEAHFSSLTVH